MRKAFEFVACLALAIALLDFMILMFTIMQIGVGHYTPHIPYWDYQIRIITSLIMQ